MLSEDNILQHKAGQSRELPELTGRQLPALGPSSAQSGTTESEAGVYLLSNPSIRQGQTPSALHMEGWGLGTLTSHCTLHNLEALGLLALSRHTGTQSDHITPTA